jgi:hypothetical protein
MVMPVLTVGVGVNVMVGVIEGVIEIVGVMVGVGVEEGKGSSHLSKLNRVKVIGGNPGAVDTQPVDGIVPINCGSF